MTAPREAVEAVQKALGCKPYDGVWNALNSPVCDRHGEDIWTDRGCPVAVAAADAAVDALGLTERDREIAAEAWDRGWSSGFYKAQARYSDDTEDASEVAARNPYAEHDPAASSRAAELRRAD